MIKIFDNVISKKESNYIKNYLYNGQFPWFYLNDVSYKNNQQEKKPGLSHYFVLGGKITGENNFKIIQNLLIKTAQKIKMEEIQIIQSRSFLQFPLSNNVVKNKYIDTPHIDMSEKHLVFLYYVNDSDGETIIYDYKDSDGKKRFKNTDLKIKKKVNPKQGRMIVFDGHYWHTGSQPKKNMRCIINTNLRIKEE